jgi:hypothetical protein
MHLASPFGKFGRLATQTEALEEGLITLVGGQLEVVEQFATTCDHLEEATTCGVIFLMRSKVLRESLIRFVRRATWTSALPVSLSWILKEVESMVVASLMVGLNGRTTCQAVCVLGCGAAKEP